jgi:dimethylargininase
LTVASEMPSCKIAITRKVSPAIVRCELTHVRREPIAVARATAQHQEYEACLVRLGCELHSLPTEPQLPDSVFVEDCAVVLDEVAVITRPGAASRRPETRSLAAALEPHRPLVRIREPATLDGGDVLVRGRTLWVGRSGRSDAVGIEQLARLLAPFGYDVKSVPVRGCLHLKSAITLVGSDTVLLNPDLVDGTAFDPMRRVEVDPGEPAGANALSVGESVVYPDAFPRTRERLEALGIPVTGVDASELAKAEGGVTCCSLIFET